MDYQTAKEAFGDITGGTFVGIDTETVVKLPGGKKNPYLIDVSPIEGWNEAGTTEEQPNKKSGWMPKGAVEVKGN